MTLSMHVSDLPLFARSDEPVFISAPSTPLEVRYARFYRSNPGIFASLERLALKQYREGASRLSIADMVEELRKQTRVKAKGENFAWNNSYRSFAARHLMHRNPILDGLFETRALKNHLKKERAVA